MSAHGYKTIAALATAPVAAGLAVVRMSGEQTKMALRAIFRGRKDPVQHPRELVFGDIIDFKSGDVIDRALAVYMPGPYSYTGEDIGEFQFHGSPLLVQKILRSIYSFGVTPAVPGEFTRRAFLNGKIDLVQAEAVGELINATSEQSLKIATEHLAGRFSDAIDKLGEPLRDALAELEAAVDFPEEEIEPKSMEAVDRSFQSVVARIDSLIASFGYGAVVKEGFRVLLCGAPNVGKSSLLNHLLGRPRAIVTPISGTTRDLIEEEVIFAGYRFVLCDSAGITETVDEVEKIGIELAKERLSWADLVLLVTDATDNAEVWKKIAKLVREKNQNIWMIVNKVDLDPSVIGRIYCDSTVCSQNFYISTKSADGISGLIDSLIQEVRRRRVVDGEASNIVTSERHLSCLQHAREALVHTHTLIMQKQPIELVIAELRIALSSLEELVGKTYTEDILGRIFSKFCIGK